MRRRTLGRELALQIAYQLDVRGDEVAGEVEELLAELGKDAEAIEFARELVTGLLKHRREIDQIIESVARNWEIRRMAVIDRNVLRLATYELLHRQDIPPLVTINEAIDIAKKYSTPKSGKFVNGILDNIRIKAGRGGGAPAAPEEPDGGSA